MSNPVHDLQKKFGSMFDQMVELEKQFKYTKDELDILYDDIQEIINEFVKKQDKLKKVIKDLQDEVKYYKENSFADETDF